MKTMDEKLVSMLTAKNRFYMWEDEETGNVAVNYDANVNNLPATVAFSIEVVRMAIRKHITPLSLLSEKPIGNQLVSPRAVHALKTALDELDKCEENAQRLAKEIKEKEEHGR